MSRTPIAVAGITKQGTDLAEVAGDPVAGNQVPNGGDVVLVVRNANTGGVSRTLRIPITATVDGQGVAPRTYTIPAGETWLLGPFHPTYYSAILQLNPDHGDLRIAAMRPGQGVDLVQRDYDRVVLGDGPVGYWTLDGTPGGLFDRTGNQRHAVAHGAPEAGDGVGGSTSTSFNGVDQWVEVANNAAWSVPATGKLTIEAWMAPDVLTFPVTQGGGDYIHWIGVGGVTPDDDQNDEWAGRLYQQFPTIEPARSNRASGYCFNLAPIGGDGHLGAGSYFQDVLVAGAFLLWTLVINTVDTSAQYPAGYVKIYRDGRLRDQDGLHLYNITPQHGAAPLRFGTQSRESFLQGRMQRVAIYPTELDASTIHTHYRAAVPLETGSAQPEGVVGSAASAAAGDRLQIVVGAAGVPAGTMLLARAVHSYSVSGPTVVDSRGNTWTTDRTGGDVSNTIRTTIFSCPVQVALRAGDLIELRVPVSVAARALVVDAWSNVQFTAVHAVNSTRGTSTTPGTTLQITAGVADVLTYGALGVAGPTADSLVDDDGNDMAPLLRAGTNTGGTDVTVNGAYRSDPLAGAKHWVPTLGTSRIWVEAVAIYAAGPPVITPPQQGTSSRVSNLVAGTSSTAGTTLVLTVPGAQTVAAGHTLVMTVNADYTASGATVADSRGNTWTRDRTSAATGNACRGAVFSCPITTALQPGDTITITWPGSVTRKSANVTHYAGLLIPTTVDAQNGIAGASGNPSLPLTSVTPNTLLVSAVAVAGPADDAYTADATWTPLPTAGTTGNTTADRTIYTQFRVVFAAQAYPFSPQLAGTRAFVAMQVAYRAA